MIECNEVGGQWPDYIALDLTARPDTRDACASEFIHDHCPGVASYRLSP